MIPIKPIIRTSELKQTKKRVLVGYIISMSVIFILGGVLAITLLKGGL